MTVWRLYKQGMFPAGVDWRLLPVQICILLTFAAAPLWLRMPYAPATYDTLYAAGFLITLPMLGTLIAWGAAGLPGVRELLNDGLRLGWAAALAAFALWMLLSGSWSFMARYDQAHVAHSAALQMLLVSAWATAAACAAPPARAIVSVLILSALWSSGLAVVQVALQHDAGLRWLGEFRLGVDRPGMSLLQADGMRWLRPYGLLPHPNVLGAVLMVGLLACAAPITSAQGFIRRIGLVAALCVLWGFLLTFSRGAWLGFAASVFALLPMLLRARRRTLWFRLALPLIAALMVGAVFVASYRPLLVARASGSESIEMRSVSDRLVFMLFAYRAATESRQNTMFGIGAGNFPWRSSSDLTQTDYDLRGQNVHHYWLSAFVETGLIGYGLLVAAVILGCEAIMRRLRSSTDSDDAASRAVLLAGVLALGITGLVDYHTWAMIQMQVLWWGLLAAAGNHGRRGSTSSSGTS